MSELAKVKQSLEPLFREAREKGLWFRSGYQGLWFHPDELERAQKEEKRFLWGAINWELRDPRERITELQRMVERAKFDLDDFINHFTAWSGDAKDSARSRA